MNKLKKITSTFLTSVLTFNIGVSCLNFNVLAEETTDGQEVNVEGLSPYTIFAGSSNNEEAGKVAINCIKSTINGNIYSDADFETSTSELKVNGRVDTTGKINNHGPNFSVETENENVSKQEMPDWNSNIMRKAGNVEVTNDEVTKISEENLKDFTLKTSGKVVIEKTDFDGVCYIISDKDITLDANNSKMPDGIVLYSKQGNIEVNGKDVDFKGIVYAPNGSVSFNNETANINGRIFGNNVNLNGNEFNVTSNVSDWEFVGPNFNERIFVSGTYDKEHNSVEIRWSTLFTFTENPVYEIQCSDDDVNYSTIANVMDKNTYQYEIIKDFDKKCFKVCFIDDCGMTIESIPFIVTKTDDGYLIQLFDTDEDELPDAYEEAIGTDINDKDTDKDGLTDYEEFALTYSNPLKYDSCEEGISDSDFDADEDGLTSIEEVQLGTNPQEKDSDNDGLNDKEEIEKYKTNPIVADTDNDKLNDGDDISLGFDPLNPDTDGNGVLDGDEKLEQTFTKDTSEKDEVVSGIEVKLTTAGNLQKTTSVKDIKDKDSMCSGVVGLIGNPYEITTESQFDKATITFKVDKEKLGDTKFEDLMFLWYDEKNDDFVELDTILDEENGTATVETTHFSKYMLVNSKEWFDLWRKISTEQTNIIKPATQASLCTAICVDCSGSMNSSDPKNLRSVAVRKYTEAMLPDDWASIIRYSGSAELIWTKEPIEHKIFNETFGNGGGTNAEAAVKLAIDNLKKDIGKNVQTITALKIKTILLLADGDVNVTNATLNEAKELGIIINSVSLGVENNTRLMQCAEATGGDYFEISEAESLAALYNQLYSKMKLSEYKNLPDSDNDLLPDLIEQSGMLLSNGMWCTTDYQNPDTDNDGLEDGKEVTLRVEEKVVSKKQSDKDENKNTNNSNDEKSDEPETVLVIHFVAKSDPTKEDTDSDGISDEEEINDHKTSALLIDTDGDGLTDGTEVVNYFDPTDKNPDGDYKSDYLEYLDGTEPYNYDKTPEEYAVEFSKGLIEGDFIEDPTMAELLGGLISSLHPAGDARDVIGNLWHGHYVMAALSAFGAWPLIGDAVGDGSKYVIKVIDFISNSLKKLPVIVELLAKIEGISSDFYKLLCKSDKFALAMEKTGSFDMKLSRRGTKFFTKILKDSSKAEKVMSGSKLAIKETVEITDHPKVWELGACARGKIIDLARNFHDSIEKAAKKGITALGKNFPVVDRLEKRILVSTKSVDLGAKSYQESGKLISKLNRDKNALLKFEEKYVKVLKNGGKGVEWGKEGAKITLKETDYSQKALEVVIPDMPISETVAEALTKFKSDALQEGIDVWYVIAK